jgi:hypothetical protein
MILDRLDDDQNFDDLSNLVPPVEEMNLLDVETPTPTLYKVTDSEEMTMICESHPFTFNSPAPSKFNLGQG